MHNLLKINLPEYTGLNKVIGWFITLRWIASAGVLIAIITAYYLFHLPLPYTILVSLNILLVVVNLFFALYFSSLKQKNLTPGEMGFFFNAQILCDYAILFNLVYFTGFLENPFIYYFVFHIMLTSFIFPSNVVKYYVSILIVFLGIILLANHSGLLPCYSLNIAGGPGATGLRFIQSAGLFSTLGISAYLITSIKNRIEERGKKVEIELNHYKSLDKIKSDFILQVTHELRGPIAAIIGYHEMILKGITGAINPKTENALRKADQRTKNLLTMIDEMLDYAYIRKDNKVKTEVSRVQIKSIIDYNIDLCMNIAASKGINIISNCAKDLMVIANRDLLNIIFSNLLNNAIKYSPKNTTVTINAFSENSKVHILVKDEGIGIGSADLINVFEEFYRTRKAREIERDGTGLGLPIVKKALERLKGEISIYSEEDKGTTFHIYLPRYYDEIHKGGTNVKQ